MDQAIADFATHLRDRNRSPLTVTRYTDLLPAPSVCSIRLHRTSP
jgi:hypothetical protein